MKVSPKSLAVNKEAFYQSSGRNKNIPFRVLVISLSNTKKTALVETTGDIKITFKCRTTNLFL